MTDAALRGGAAPGAGIRHPDPTTTTTGQHRHDTGHAGIPGGTTLNIADALDRNTLFFPDKDAVVDMGRRWTYTEFRRDADRFAHALVDLGVEKGDRVCVFLGNSAEFALAFYGIFKVGAIAVSISAACKTRRGRVPAGQLRVEHPRDERRAPRRGARARAHPPRPPDRLGGRRRRAPTSTSGSSSTATPTRAPSPPCTPTARTGPRSSSPRGRRASPRASSSPTATWSRTCTRTPTSPR